MLPTLSKMYLHSSQEQIFISEGDTGLRHTTISNIVEMSYILYCSIVF